MPLTGVEVEGKAEVARAFDTIAKKAADAHAIAAELGAIGASAARAAAPVGATGTVQSSIAAEVGTNGADISSEVGYAQFPEFGTVYQPALRFMGAGYGAMNDRAEQIATAWVDGILADAERTG